MNRQKKLILLSFMGLISFIAIISITRFTETYESSFNPNEPQCGHWAILRSCELLGVPIEMQTIKELMPPKEKGASMLELHNVFKKIGLQVTGYHETLEGLSKYSCPFVAHLDGSHFITVSAMDDKKTILFDGSGRARTMTLSEFDYRWSKTILVVEHVDKTVPLPKFTNRRLKGSPCIEFETLIIDKGDIPWSDKEVEFEFSVYNIGEAPLIIKDVGTDCGCLEAESPNKPILPGGNDKIRLKYRLQEGQGSYIHEALVKSNDPSLPLVKLTAAGNTDTKISITPNQVYFCGIIPGQTKTEIVNLHYTGDFPFEIREVLCEKKRVKVAPFLLTEESARNFQLGLLSHKNKPKIIPNTYVLQLTYEAKVEDVGETKIDTVIVNTNIEGFKNISIPVYAKVTNPVDLYPSVLLFTGVKPDEVITKSLEVVPFEDISFEIISVKTENTGISYSIKPKYGNRKTIEFSAKGVDLLNFSEANFEIEIGIGGDHPMKYYLALPVYIN